MRIILLVVLVLHGAIHLLGPAKAWGLAELPQLTRPISGTGAMLWLLACVLLFAAAGALFVWPRGWWMIGIAGALVSQAVIITSWDDARVGTLANLFILAAAVYWVVRLRAEMPE